MTDQLPHRLDVELLGDSIYVDKIVCPYDPNDESRPCAIADDGTPAPGCIIVDWFDAAGMEAIDVEGFVFSTEVAYAGFDEGPKIRSFKAHEAKTPA